MRMVVRVRIDDAMLVKYFLSCRSHPASGLIFSSTNNKDEGKVKPL